MHDIGDPTEQRLDCNNWIAYVPELPSSHKLALSPLSLFENSDWLSW